MNKKTEKKLQLIVILILLVVGLKCVSAQENDLDISIEPRYYYQGYEVEPTPGLNYSAIKFDIVGKNLNEEGMIKNLHITDAYPESFKDSLPEEKKELRILEEKKLWSSTLIPITDFKNNTVFTITVKGDLQYGDEVTARGTLEDINTIKKKTEKVKNKPLLYIIGEKIYPSHPDWGIGIFIGLIFIVLYSVWYYMVPEKLNKKRINDEKKRKQKSKSWEGF